MKKNSRALKMKAGSLLLGPFKKVTYYQADIEGPDAELDMIVNVGKQVVTREQYLNISSAITLITWQSSPSLPMASVLRSANSMMRLRLYAKSCLFIDALLIKLYTFLHICICIFCIALPYTKHLVIDI